MKAPANDLVPCLVCKVLKNCETEDCTACAFGGVTPLNPREKRLAEALNDLLDANQHADWWDRHVRAREALKECGYTE